MIYDPYKLGFSYYCDNKTISYNILNTMALKYTRMFSCVDFFMDNEVIETHSPLWDIHLNEKRKMMNKIKKKTKMRLMQMIKTIEKGIKRCPFLEI